MISKISISQETPLKRTTFLIALIAAVLFLSACDQLAGPPSLAVMDLEAIANATGRNEQIQQKMEAARAELNTQLTSLAAGLEQQLTDERAKIGDSPSPEQQKEYQQLAQQAQQQYGQGQARAQQGVQEFRTELVAEFRDSVKAVAATIAAERGALVALAVGPAMLWFDNSIDITDEVIAALQAAPVAQTPVTPEIQETAAPPETPAEPAAEPAATAD